MLKAVLLFGSLLLFAIVCVSLFVFDALLNFVQGSLVATYLGNSCLLGFRT